MADQLGFLTLEEMASYQPPRCRDCGGLTRVVGWDLIGRAGEDGAGWRRGPLRCLARDEQADPDRVEHVDDWTA
jgi:hypothetical protein